MDLCVEGNRHNYCLIGTWGPYLNPQSSDPQNTGLDPLRALLSVSHMSFILNVGPATGAVSLTRLGFTHLGGGGSQVRRRGKWLYPTSTSACQKPPPQPCMKHALQWAGSLLNTNTPEPDQSPFPSELRPPVSRTHCCNAGHHTLQCLHSPPTLGNLRTR